MQYINYKETVNNIKKNHMVYNILYNRELTETTGRSKSSLASEYSSGFVLSAITWLTMSLR